MNNSFGPIIKSALYRVVNRAKNTIFVTVLLVPFSAKATQLSKYCQATLDLVKEQRVLLISFKGNGYWKHHPDTIRDPVLSIKKYGDSLDLSRFSTDKDKAGGLFDAFYNMAVLHRDKILGLSYSHQGRNAKHAANCAAAMRTKLGEDLKIILLGYSNGGHTALKFARRFEEQIDFAVIVDPIPIPAAMATNIFTLGLQTEAAMQKAPNVVELWNFYQRSDTKSLGIGLKGHSVKNADFEKLYAPRESSTYIDPKFLKYSSRFNHLEEEQLTKLKADWTSAHVYIDAMVFYEYYDEIKDRIFDFN